MTNDKQQTPVEWLYLELFYFLNGQSKFEDAEKILERAKEMEKEQIIDAFWNGDDTDCTSEQNIKDFAEQYYNETYGGNE